MSGPLYPDPRCIVPRCRRHATTRHAVCEFHLSMQVLVAAAGVLALAFVGTWAWFTMGHR